MSYYVIRQRHAIPSFLFCAIASWVVSNVVLIVVSIAFWITQPHSTVDLSNAFPWPALVVAILVIFYAALGTFALYILMWVYWVSVKHSAIALRILWFFVLLFGLHFGAVLYALIVWKRDIQRIEGPQPIEENFSALGII